MSATPIERCVAVVDSGRTCGARRDVAIHRPAEECVFGAGTKPCDWPEMHHEFVPEAPRAVPA